MIDARLATRLLAVLAMLGAGTTTADELGRLFLAPAEREALDQARYATPVAVGEAAGDTTAAAIPEADVEVPPEMPVEVLPNPPVVVDGYVRRSDGPATVWINGTDTGEGNLADFGIEARDVQVERDRVRVPIGSDETVSLKPGQTFDPVSARVTDAYEKPPDGFVPP
ncbi:MAG: hypothetical protein AB7Q81_13815 [Gammaproteobacteria bacterium]